MKKCSKNNNKPDLYHYNSCKRNVKIFFWKNGRIMRNLKNSYSYMIMLKGYLFVNKLSLGHNRGKKSLLKLPKMRLICKVMLFMEYLIIKITK
jgi:hypothetical protein